MHNTELKVALVGLGYVGLPLALAFGRADVSVIGFDVNAKLVHELTRGIDSSGELESELLAQSSVQYTTNAADLEKANFIIVTVPTPIGAANAPDLTYVEKATETVAKHLKKGAIVVYESTVYPGVTEEICIPILEKTSGLTFGKDFAVGYSPERINPGDKEHSLQTVVKVVAASDPQAEKRVVEAYSMVCPAGLHVAPTIRVAEAAKVVENVQRDMNISVMNELALIFWRLGINTQDVLTAAGTKWNFMAFQPGLVGGHCIGVDPYYLVYKAEDVGYHPGVIAAGRRVNDYMAEFVAERVLKALALSGKPLKGAKVLVMGLTFKENVRDMRNSKIQDTIDMLKGYGLTITGFDPKITRDEVQEVFKVEPVDTLKGEHDVVIIAVPHAEFEPLYSQLPKHLTKDGIVFDIKGRAKPQLTKGDYTYLTL